MLWLLCSSFCCSPLVQIHSTLHVFLLVDNQLHFGVPCIVPHFLGRYASTRRCCTTFFVLVTLMINFPTGTYLQYLLLPIILPVRYSRFLMIHTLHPLSLVTLHGSRLNIPMALALRTLSQTNATTRLPPFHRLASATDISSACITQKPN